MRLASHQTRAGKDHGGVWLKRRPIDVDVLLARERRRHAQAYPAGFVCPEYRRVWKAGARAGDDRAARSAMRRPRRRASASSGSVILPPAEPITPIWIFMEGMMATARTAPTTNSSGDGSSCAHEACASAKSHASKPRGRYSAPNYGDHALPSIHIAAGMHGDEPAGPQALLELPNTTPSIRVFRIVCGHA